MSLRWSNFIVLIVVLGVSVSAQDTDSKGGSVVDLGRRAKLVLEKGQRDATNGKNDPGSVVLDLSLDSVLGVFDAFFASFSMILVSEIGDGNFYNSSSYGYASPQIVLSGALSALFVMTVLSTGLGRIVPNLISRKHTNSAATVLYAFFGLRLLYIAWRSDSSKASQKKRDGGGIFVTLNPVIFSFLLLELLKI